METQEIAIKINKSLLLGIISVLKDLKKSPVTIKEIFNNSSLREELIIEAINNNPKLFIITPPKDKSLEFELHTIEATKEADLIYKEITSELAEKIMKKQIIM